MSIQNLLNIGTNSLTAYRGAMEVSSQNAANVGTAGYTRRRGTLASLSLGRDVPAGVQFKNPKRIIDHMAGANVRRSMAQSAALEARVPTLRSLEAILAPVEGSLTQRVGELFDAFGQLSTRAGGLEERSALLNTAQTMAEAFRNTSAQLTAMQRPLVKTAEDQAGRINTLTQQIADLNADIRANEGSGEAADLRDRRDSLLDELSGLANISVLEHEDGAVTVSLSQGATLVSDNAASNVSVGFNGERIQVTVQRKSGTPELVLRDSSIGGALGASVQSHNVDLMGAMEDLDTVAFALAEAVNELHNQGVGLDGQGNRDFFTVDGLDGAASSLRLSEDVDGDPQAIAATRSADRLPGGADLLSELVDLRNADLDSLGGITLEDGLTTMQLELGRELETVEDGLEVALDQQNLFENLRASTQGVNLDEEIADLLRFQRGFEAAGRVVQVADEVMQTLLSLV
jgi:flagellar hook-associated protein 1 FlgK